MSFLGSLLGIMGHLGRFLPNYVTGYRQAWQDNWSDAANYNQVLNGQMQNLFGQQAFGPELNMLYDRAGMSRNQADMSDFNMALYQAAYPGLYNAQLLQSQYQPDLTNLAIQQQLHPGLQAVQQEQLFGNYGYQGPLTQSQLMWQNYLQQQAQQQALAAQTAQTTQAAQPQPDPEAFTKKPVP